MSAGPTTWSGHWLLSGHAEADRPAAPASQSPLPTVSTRLVQLFACYAGWFLCRHFSQVRILGAPPRASTGPLIIYANHPSWWDPLVLLQAARRYWPERTSFAPMDAAALEKYRFFKRLGFFPVGRGVRDAYTFLRVSQAILAQESRMLWITPQGKFCDARQRPVQFQQGIGHLARRVPGATFIPLAIDYAFGSETRPMISLNFGQPVTFKSPKEGVTARTKALEKGLEVAQDSLAEAIISGDHNTFQILLQGKAGIHAVYDGWRWIAARLRGKRFSPGHGIR